MDLEFLQRVCTKVNVIPVIGRADSLLPNEIATYKAAVLLFLTYKILREFEQHDIRAYPTFHADDKEFISELEQYMPFSIIGSDKLISVKGKMVRGRTYRWGSVEVENPLHCDFLHLKQMLIRYTFASLFY